MNLKWNISKEWIESSNNIVFFGGAGVSTESGIPDFRGENGLYKQKREIPLETILSHNFFFEHPEEYYRFYRSSSAHTQAKPNKAHYRLAELEQAGKLKAVITQNADGLHQAAGSKTVYELHGNGNRFFCVKCKKEYPSAYIDASTEAVPHCDCGGIFRPGAVFFGENLDSRVLKKAVEAIGKADMLIVGGTSLVVYPAAGLIDYALHYGNGWPRMDAGGIRCDCNRFGNHSVCMDLQKNDCSSRIAG